MENRLQIHTLALALRGCPYIWGGKRPWPGFDCSGFAAWVLIVTGNLPPGEYNDQHLSQLTSWRTLRPAELQITGDLAFYGQDTAHVTHVMLALDPENVIGAHGAGHTCTTPEAAKALGAAVGVKPTRYRSDFLFIRTPAP
jgi:cell wall-associated NlpC family hydrolase